MKKVAAPVQSIGNSLWWLPAAQRNTIGDLVRTYASVDWSWECHPTWSDRVYLFVYTEEGKFRFTVGARGAIHNGGRAVRVGEAILPKKA